MKERVKNIFNIMLTILCITTITVSAASLIKSSDVVYDNKKSGIESTTVQGAVDELYSAATDYSSIIQRLSALESSSFLNAHPVGSIYITISENENTVTKMHNLYGGTWQRYSEGRTLVGVGTGTDSNGTAKVFNKNESAGEYNHTILTSELPSHNHSIPSLSVSTWEGRHSHTPYQEGYFYATRGITESTVTGLSSGSEFNQLGAAGGVRRTGSTSGVTITVSGQTTTASQTGNIGSNSSINITQPYITVYMYKRVS